MAVPETGQDLDVLLRRCVQCGLCLPHCATWLASGDETRSPRGRLVLLAAQRAGEDADGSFLRAFDTCIGCRACETACPSGVPYSLLEEGRHTAEGHVAASAGPPGPLLRRLDRPAWLGALRVAGALGRGVLRLVGGRRWRRRLDGAPLVRLLGSTPRDPGPDARLVARLDALTGAAGAWATPAAGGGAGPVVVFRGCANEGLLPHAARRTRALLRACGHTLLEAPGQDCCGALAAHGGRPGRAAHLRARNAAALAATPSDAPVVVEAAGCGLALGEGDPALATRVVDAAVLLADADLPPLAPVPLKVALHDPCHLRHGQGVVAETRRLLGRIPGVTVLEPEEAEVCCGSGGAWGLRYPELSEQLGRRKARLLAATGADVVVTTNPGCLGQIADGLALEGPALPILPLTDLVWYAAARAR